MCPFPVDTSEKDMFDLTRQAWNRQFLDRWMHSKEIGWDDILPGPRREIKKWLRRPDDVDPFAEDKDLLDFWEARTRPTTNSTKRRKPKKQFIPLGV